MKKKLLIGALVLSCFINILLIGVNTVEAKKKEPSLNSSQSALKEYGLLGSELNQEKLEKIMHDFQTVSRDPEKKQLEYQKILIEQNWFIMEQNEDIKELLKKD
ncbi:hypothetical protein ACYSNR_07615 [Enterococcus sp. LJL128]|uniref:hypothetical protein n=1 Tax=Enterococcus sp. LJL51 TaxID=3416656 RepID=UPI003CE8A076